MRTAVAVVLLTLCFQCLAKRPDCDRRPSKSSNALKSPGNNGFQIMVKPYPWNGSADEVTGYIPGEKYTIVIQGWKTRFTVQTFRGFTLAALSSNDDNEPAGLFQLKEDGDIRWSVDCWHAVTHSSMIPKENVSVTWQAPPQEEGCVLFKAAVLEYPNIWYMDDDDLSAWQSVASQVYPSECKDFSEYLLASRASGSETETSEDLENKNKKECTVLNWAPWSLCSATCGKGIRMRTRGYRNPIKAHIMGCSRQMNEKQFCNALLSVCHGSENFNDQCAASPWAQWTACSAKCGQGMRSRVRNYLNPMAIKQCSIPLTENENCTGAAGLDCNIAEDPLCQTTPWSDWSPCSRSCDEGIRLRTRILYRPENQDSCNHLEIVQKESCNLLSCATFMRTHAAEICSELMERGQCEGTFPRYYFDPGSKTCQRFTYTGCKGNRNNFLTIEHCKQTCLTEGDNAVDNQVNEGSDFNGLSDISKHADGLPKDCVVSGWSDWSDCSQTCGRGMKERVRTILSPAQNGGQPCPVELVEKARCRLRPCSVICRISSWSSWSACSASCGTGVQIRQRTAKNPHKQPECPYRTHLGYLSRNLSHQCRKPQRCGHRHWKTRTCTNDERRPL